MSLILPGGKKNAYIQDGLQKIHTVFDDGSECVEEFHIQDQVTVIRRWRRKDTLGRISAWDVEIGDMKQEREVISGLFQADNAPVVCRLDVEGYYVFKITNMPSPESNYRCDVEGDDLVVRTANKKYFKRLQITDLLWQKIPLVQ